MYSESGLKKWFAVCVVLSIIIGIFTIYGLMLLKSNSYLADGDLYLMFYFGAFSAIALSILSIIMSIVTRQIRISLQDEIAFLTARITELEKQVKKQ